MNSRDSTISFRIPLPQLNLKDYYKYNYKYDLIKPKRPNFAIFNNGLFLVLVVRVVQR